MNRASRILAHRALFIFGLAQTLAHGARRFRPGVR
jgi:hypothetical protein